MRKEDDVSALKRRIFKYLNSNEIRPELWTALEGLKANRNFLQGRVDSILDAPWKKEERQAAIAALTQITEELEAFLRGLGEHLTGVGVDVLLVLQHCLERPRLEGSDLTNILGTQRATEDLQQRKWLAERTERTIATILESF